MVHVPYCLAKKPTVLLKHNDAIFYVEMGESLSGNAQRISNFIQKLDSHVETLAEKRKEYKKRIQSLETEITRDNPYIERIRNLESEVKKLKVSMNVLPEDKKRLKSA